MKAYILMKIQTGEIAEAVRQMRDVPGVETAEMTFGPYDAVAVIEAGDLKGLGQRVAWDLQTIPGVLQTLTCLAVDVDA